MGPIWGFHFLPGWTLTPKVFLLPSRLVGESQAHRAGTSIISQSRGQPRPCTTHPHLGQLTGEKRPGEEEKVTLGTHLLCPLICALGLLEMAQATTPPNHPALQPWGLEPRGTFFLFTQAIWAEGGKMRGTTEQKTRVRRAATLARKKNPKPEIRYLKSGWRAGSTDSLWFRPLFWYYKENWLQVWVEHALLSGMSCGDTPERSLWVSWVWIYTSGDLSPTWIFMKSKQYFKRGNWKPCSSDHAEFWESNFQFSSVQSLSRVRLFATQWTTACQASLSITNFRGPPKPMSIKLMMPSNHLIL